MARNSEKAQSMLNRWLAMKRGYIIGSRPTDPNTVQKLSMCHRWRNQVIKNIVRKVSLIQNVSLGEHKIRDLNEEINTLLKEKDKWEDRMVELNGPDYRSKSSIFDEDGEEVLVINGYFYFGASKLLPQVQEHLKKKKKTSTKLTKDELVKCIDIEYFGFIKDEEELIKIEKMYEQKEKETAQREWERIQKNKMDIDTEIEEVISIDVDQIPSLDVIQKKLLEKRKMDIIGKLM